MVSWRYVVRFVVAAALALAGLVGVDSSPAAALVTIPVSSCSAQSVMTVLGGPTGEVFRAQLIGSSCVSVKFDEISGSGATATADSLALADGSVILVNSGALIEVQAPASGYGSIMLSFYNSNSSSAPHHSVTLCYGDDGAASGSLVDNGNGSVTFTYAGDNGECQNNYISVYPAGTTCPLQAPLQSRIGVLVSEAVSPAGTLGASPAFIAAGTVVTVPGANFTTATLVAGTTYVLCYYNYDWVNFQTFVQALSVTLQNVAPPTPPTSPVAPAYTG